MSGSFDFQPSSIVEGANVVVIPGLGRVMVRRVYPSHNRYVFRAMPIGSPDTRLVIKTFVFDGGFVTSAEKAQAVMGDIRTYRSYLHAAGVPLTDSFGFNCHTNSDGRTVLIQYEPYAGKTCSKVFRDFSVEAACLLLHDICRQIVKPLFLNGSDSANNSLLTVGLDLNLRNITVKGDSEEGFELTYIDLFPWKFKRLDGDYTLEFPEPTDLGVRTLGVWRHFNKAGLIINLFISLCRAKPDGAEEFYYVLEKFLRDAGFDDVETSIDEFTEGLDLSVGKKPWKEISELVSNWGFADIFKLRLLACAGVFCRRTQPYLRDYLDRAIQASHFQDRPLSDASLQVVKNLVRQIFESPAD